MKALLHRALILPIPRLLFAWLCLLFAVSVISDKVIPYDPSFPYVEINLASSELPKYIYSWANFDGVHYITIAREGYLSVSLIQAFFPFFPILLSVARHIHITYIAFGLILNIVVSSIFVSIWYYYQRSQRVSGDIARYAVVSFLVFPTSFFLISLYSESIFLLLCMATFIAVSHRKWFIAAVCIGLATATRLVGIFLVPMIMLALLEDSYTILTKIKASNVVSHSSFQHTILSNIFSALSIITIGSSGLLAFMYYLQKNFNDALYFFHVQAEFGGIREESIVFLPQVLFRYLKILFTLKPFTLQYYSSVQELSLTALVVIGLLISWRKKLLPLYQIYFSIAAIVLPSLTGTLSSMPRYVLVALPAFTAFGWVLTHYPWLRPWWIGCSTFLLVFNTILFVQGYWVA